MYTKLYLRQAAGASVMQTWESADGTRLGLQDAGVNLSGALPACRGGFWVLQGRRPARRGVKDAL